MDAVVGPNGSSRPDHPGGARRPDPPSEAGGAREPDGLREPGGPGPSGSQGPSGGPGPSGALGASRETTASSAGDASDGPSASGASGLSGGPSSPAASGAPDEPAASGASEGWGESSASGRPSAPGGSHGPGAPGEPGGSDAAGAGQEADAAVRALVELRAGLERTITELGAAAARADQLIEQRAAGRSWHEIVSAERPPLVIETITRALEDLGELGGRFRREEALALQREGVTITRIGELFRVTRQRASALLQERPPRSRDGSGPA